jgi:streptogramin lyase
MWDTAAPTGPRDRHAQPCIGEPRKERYSPFAVLAWRQKRGRVQQSRGRDDLGRGSDRRCRNRRWVRLGNETHRRNRGTDPSRSGHEPSGRRADIEVGPGPIAALYGFGALWITNSSPSSVVRVDPSTGTVTTMGFTGRLAAGSGSLWAASDGSVVRADPKTGHPTATVRVPRAQTVAVGQGRVWVLASAKSSSPTLFYPVKNTAALWEIDPVNNRIVGRPFRLAALQPLALAVGGRAVWVADYDSGTISRFDLVRCARSSCDS